MLEWRNSAPKGGGSVTHCGTPKQAGEKLDSVTSAAKAFTDSRAFTAALKALRHPKPEFFRSL
jgi:hypothetical protein